MKKLLLIIALGACVFTALSANAQSAPEILLTWQGKNYTPGWYIGRSLPIKKTGLAAAVELVYNGKIADLSKTEIRWFLGTHLYKLGLGTKIFPFATPSFTNEDRVLRVVVFDYLGQNYEKSVRIPLINPDVVIDAPYPDGKIAASLNGLKAIPFYFNAARENIKYSWVANNEKADAGTSANDISVDASRGESGSQVKISVRAFNGNDILEFADSNINFLIK